MKTLRILILISISFLTTSCYRKLYEQCTNEKLNYLKDNQTCLDNNRDLKQENGEIKKENQNLKVENQQLTLALEAEKRKTKKFSLTFRQLCCDKTTNLGADEVYFTVLGTKIGSDDFFTKVPNGKPWDMNDGKQPNDNPTGDSHCLTNRTLYSGELKPGETFYLNISLCEEDGGTSKDYQAKVASILKASGDPFSMAAGSFIGILTDLNLYFKDTDDWMGMFGLKVTNNDGILNVEWLPKEGVVHMIPDPSYPMDPNRKEMRMKHDGSNYVGWYNVQY